MPESITRRMLGRLPAPPYDVSVPETTDVFGATRNGNFELADAGSATALDWARSTTHPAIFEAEPFVSQGRVVYPVDMRAATSPFAPVVEGASGYVLGDLAFTGHAKPAYTVPTGGEVLITSAPVDMAGVSSIRFRYSYVSETAWTSAGQWRGSFEVAGGVLWTVDLFGGARLDVRDIQVGFVSSGLRALVFRLRNFGAAYTGPLPTFLVDDVRLVRVTRRTPTILYSLFRGIAAGVARARDTLFSLRDLSRLAKALGLDLDILGADVGVARPQGLALSEQQYANLIRYLTVETAGTTEDVVRVVEILTGMRPTATEGVAEVRLALPSQTVVQPFRTWFYG